MKIVSKKTFLVVSFGFTNQTQILYDQNLHKIHLQKESNPIVQSVNYRQNKATLQNDDNYLSSISTHFKSHKFICHFGTWGHLDIQFIR